MTLAIEDGVNGHVSRSGSARRRSGGALRRAAPALAEAEIAALVTTGLAGLFALPFLLLLSIGSEAPVAVPAAIAVANLGVAHAARTGHARLANRIGLAMLAGYVAASAMLLPGVFAGANLTAFAGLFAALLFAGLPSILVLARASGAPAAAEAARPADRAGGDARGA
ncbi:hypothetical protein, partial [Propylenella binzhouense]